jgi:hypothetical protein
MTQPTYPRVAWTGVIDNETYRVVDNGIGADPRLVVELRQQADAMGARGWSRFEPIPRRVFEQMLIAAKVVPS